ncbi:glycoside hydrolase family 3 protein [Parathielavia appendiculata]|uniref:beta-glucosidase n=1 Tax=Parathielavia appendiculata TaxID=2587402 RepID=A0AAN6TYQ0_9PEZI|nr:glycoside hydrolase family 3 protein [Parathielavia appendiculata]
MVNVPKRLVLLAVLLSAAATVTDGVEYFETLLVFPTRHVHGLSCNGNIRAIPEIEFQGLCLADGPVSVSITDLSTVFSAGLTAAATWDRSLMHERGRAIRAEFRGKGASVHLGFFPDPYLSGVAMSYSIKGIQEMGIQASPKHLIGKGQETYNRVNLTAAVLNGTVSEAKVDDIARRVPAPYLFLRRDQEFPTIDPSTGYVFARTYDYPVEDLSLAGMDPNCPPPARNSVNHAEVVRKVAAAGTVLLKNTNSVLAPESSRGLTFTGDGSGPWGPNIGALSVGGGSQLLAIREGLLDKAMMGTDDFSSIYLTADGCLVFLKTWAREGIDCSSFENDWHSTTVVENVARRCANTIVVTHSGDVNTMPWADHTNVAAILAAHYPGQENGYSISDVLFGDATDSAAWQADFTESQLIDYRHFDAKNITPLYEFGFGMSYTTFELVKEANLHKKSSNLSPFSPPPTNGAHVGGHPAHWRYVATISAVVKNMGDVPGAQIVQLYVAFPQDYVPSGTQVKALRGFEKVELEPGEAKRVKLPRWRRDVSYWNVGSQDWEIPKGEMQFHLGFDSRDIKATITSALLGCRCRLRRVL